MKLFRPTTPSRRKMSVVDYKKTLSKREPFKKLVSGFKRAKGRSRGKITTRHKGGGSKRLYRKIDFTYDKRDISARVETVEYDPNRSGFISLVLYADGVRRYILAPAGLKPGDQFVVSRNAKLAVGNRLPLSKIPSGTLVHNVEIQPGTGAKLARSAGSSAEVLAREKGYVNLKLSSGEIRRVSEKCWASIGSVSNEEHGLVRLGKAGRSRWRGKRPTVRGTAMNPVDHPLGGGEGRSGAGMKRVKNKWGKGVRGVKTRKRKKYSDSFILKRRKKKKRKR
jgi:large subunit ribosomal protein L2